MPLFGKLVAGLVLIFVQAAVYAHHSRANFDLNQEIALEGEVVEVGWTNPHFYLGLKDGDGRLWTLEGHSIPGLVRYGWRKDTLKVGGRVRVVANPDLDSSLHFALLSHVTREDGKTFYSFRPTEDVRAAMAERTVQPSKDFTGTWRLIRSLRDNLVGVFEPPDWPFTDAGAAQVSTFNRNEDPLLNCEPRGLPGMLTWPYAQHWRNVGQGLAVTIEHSVEQRLIYNSADEAQRGQDAMGVSVLLARGAKEMVIQTGGFSAKTWGLGRGVNSSAKKTITETYRLADDGISMSLVLEISDPVMLRRPIVLEHQFEKIPDFQFAAEPPCDTATARRHLQFEAQ